MTKAKQDQEQHNKKLTPLGRATEQTKGWWGAYREEGGSASKFGEIP